MRHPLLASFAFSVVLNAAVFTAFDRALVQSVRTLSLSPADREKLKKDTLEFEFVEAPPKSHPQVPRRTRRISDRDALSRDLFRKKTPVSGDPKIRLRGLANQLAQRRAAREKARQSQAAEQPRVSPPIGEARPSGGTPAPQSSQTAPTAVPDVVGLTGADRITTQEMAKTESRGAMLFGTTSFEAAGTGMGEYMKKIKERIWLSWFPPVAFKYPQEFRGADAIIRFTLSPKGEMKILKIVEHNGNALFASYCMDAVQRASGFGDVPKEILALTGKEDLEITFAFHYR